MNLISVGNRLSQQKSPYLLQHQNNPVWWWPWCDDAIAAAREQDKPIFLSIGYATCYWCHVMEQDSFEQQEVADLLNEHFIAIKLDREERPDIDALYMDAVVGMTGQGGWPMSVFLTPDRVPFWSGTFFYRAQFMQILERINYFWTGDREKILGSVQQISGFLQRRALPEARPGNREGLSAQAFFQLKEVFDPEYGGFGPAPKFPPTGALGLLSRVPDAEAAGMVRVTLDAMAKGGLFDQIGGGFARYSTDRAWLVPHFEKMLYDNALLVSSYLEGWQLTGCADYLSIVRETLEFVLRELATPEGAFCSALDAGAVGQEGEFYVWAHRDVRALLDGEEFARFSDVYGLTPEGNFEAKNTVLGISRAFELSVRREPLLKRAREKLLSSRATRVRPICDDKVLVSWNGLMISALSRSFSLTGEPAWRDAAEKATEFILTRLFNGTRLLRRYRDGEAAFEGCLEDYAYLIDGIIELALATGDFSYIARAKELQALQDAALWDEQVGAYFMSAGNDLIVRKFEFADGALPSPNSIALLNLRRLALLAEDTALHQRAERLARELGDRAANHPEAFSRYLMSENWHQRAAQLVIVVPFTAELPEQEILSWKQTFRPGLMIVIVREGEAAELPALARGKSSIDGKITGYLCRGNTCQAPCTDIPGLLAGLDSRPIN